MCSFLKLFVFGLFQDRMGQMCMLVCVLFVLLASLTLTIVALLTDRWYRVYTNDNINPDIKKSYNFNYGLWRLCYDDMPTGKTQLYSYMMTCPLVRHGCVAMTTCLLVRHSCVAVMTCLLVRHRCIAI